MAGRTQHWRNGCRRVKPNLSRANRPERVCYRWNVGAEMMPFFVPGLPRSRTAWLANWLTTDTSLCLHDVRYSKTLLQGGRRVGFAGPELLDQSNEILGAHPQSRWLVVC